MKCPSHVLPDAHGMELVTWGRRQAGRRASGTAEVAARPRSEPGQVGPLPLQGNGRGGKGEGMGSITGASKGNGVG